MKIKIDLEERIVDFDIGDFDQAAFNAKVFFNSEAVPLFFPDGVAKLIFQLIDERDCLSIALDACREDLSEEVRQRKSTPEPESESTEVTVTSPDSPSLKVAQVGELTNFGINVEEIISLCKAGVI